MHPVDETELSDVHEAVTGVSAHGTDVDARGNGSQEIKRALLSLISSRQAGRRTEECVGREADEKRCLARSYAIRPLGHVALGQGRDEGESEKKEEGASGLHCASTIVVENWMLVDEVS